MSLVSTLPFEPQQDESARGLVMRVAEYNLCTPTEMAGWLALPEMGDALACDPAPAAKELGMAPDDFARMGFAGTASEVVLGHDVPSDLVARQIFRTCPRCLAGAGYHRRIWDHKQITVCPVHRVQLIERCGRCEADSVGLNLTWRRPGINLCRFGHDLTEQAGLPTTAFVGTSAIYRYLGLICDGPDLPASFRALPLQDLLDVLFFLGRMEVVVASGKFDEFNGHEMRTAPDILDAGVAIACGWPETFHRMAVAVAIRHHDRIGLSATYDSLHRFISACDGKPYASLLREAYALHLSRRPDISTGVWPSFLPAPPPAVPTVFTVDRALKALSFDGSKRVSLKHHPLWRDLKRVPRGSVSNYFLLEEEVTALGAELRASISPRFVDKVLGLGAGRTQLLCQAGLIEFREGAGARGRAHDRIIPLREIDRIKALVRKAATARAPARPVSLNEVLQRAVRPKFISFQDVILAVLDGHLPSHLAAAAGPCFSSLAFDEIHVDDWISGQATKGAELRLGTVAERLGVETEAVHQLVAAKLLPKPKQGHGYLFATVSVAAFEAEFVFDVCLPRPLRGKLGKLRERLALAGAHPVVMVALGAGKRTTAVYRRADLKRVGVSLKGEPIALSSLS